MRYSWFLVAVTMQVPYGLSASAASAQTQPAMAPAVLPGNGLAQHPFFYAGEDKVQSMYIVRDGKIVWSHTRPNSRGEISDAYLRASGNVLFAHQYGVTEISPQKAVVWHLDAPAGTEIHTAQPLAGDLVMFVQNGNPAFLKVINRKTGKTELEFTLPVKNPKGVHGQFRHARMTDKGTFLVAHMDMDKVCEYDGKGKEIWSVEAPSPWSAARLANGNTLITSNRSLVREVNHDGKTIWELTQADIPDYRLVGTQLSVRLTNGNTLINNWWNNWSGRVDPDNPPVQAVEVTPEKKVVWALRSWKEPANLGPSTTIQLLDQSASAAEMKLPERK